MTIFEPVPWQCQDNGGGERGEGAGGDGVAEDSRSHAAAQGERDGDESADQRDDGDDIGDHAIGQGDRHDGGGGGGQRDHHGKLGEAITDAMAARGAQTYFSWIDGWRGVGVAELFHGGGGGVKLLLPLGGGGGGGGRPV